MLQIPQHMEEIVYNQHTMKIFLKVEEDDEQT